MIQMSAEELNRHEMGGISVLRALALPVLEHRRRLYRRYARKEGETGIMGSGTNRGCVPFEYYIVNMVQGYLGGKAPMYAIAMPSDYALARVGKTVDEAGKRQYVRDYGETLDYIQRYNDDAATFVELIHDYLITGAAYLYLYESADNEIVYTRLSSRQTVAIYDYASPPNQIGAVRLWVERAVGRQVEVTEVISAQARRVYRDGALAQEELFSWGDIPCVAFENPDGMAVFEPALYAIDAFEQNLDNIRSMTQYNDNAKLLLKNYTFQNDAMITDENGREVPNPARQAEERALLEAKALAVGQDGDILWLIKNVDYSGVLETLRCYHDLITMLAGVPNMTDEAFSSADNASALGYKLYALDQYSATFDRVAQKGYLRLWEIITRRLNLKGASFDFRDITVKLQRNVPTDKDKSLARSLNAYQGGLISQETAINESQLEIDAKDEMMRQRAEQEEDYQAMRHE